MLEAEIILEGTEEVYSLQGEVSGTMDFIRILIKLFQNGLMNIEYYLVNRLRKLENGELQELLI